MVAVFAAGAAAGGPLSATVDVELVLVFPPQDAKSKLRDNDAPMMMPCLKKRLKNDEDFTAYSLNGCKCRVVIIARLAQVRRLRRQCKQQVM